ncbi:hypothetical protein FLA_2498 [Filimonas lacunae]|nr:hypothetical protein FLA_2498 [Filimonas lacunae]
MEAWTYRYCHLYSKKAIPVSADVYQEPIEADDRITYQLTGHNKGILVQQLADYDITSPVFDKVIQLLGSFEFDSMQASRNRLAFVNLVNGLQYLNISGYEQALCDRFLGNWLFSYAGGDFPCIDHRFIKENGHIYLEAEEKKLDIVQFVKNTVMPHQQNVVSFCESLHDIKGVLPFVLNTLEKEPGVISEQLYHSIPYYTYCSWDEVSARILKSASVYCSPKTADTIFKNRRAAPLDSAQRKTKLVKEQLIDTLVAIAAFSFEKMESFLMPLIQQKEWQTLDYFLSTLVTHPTFVRKDKALLASQKSFLALLPDEKWKELL